MTKEDLDAMMVLLADVRDDIVAAAQALTSAPRPGSQPPGPPVPAPPFLGWRSAWLGLVLGGVLLGGVLGWAAAGFGQRGLQAHARLMGQVDALLTERYDGLPPRLREQLQALYVRAGFQPLGDRKP